MQEEDAGGMASELWSLSLSSRFLLEPSPSWAGHEKQGFLAADPKYNPNDKTFQETSQNEMLGEGSRASTPDSGTAESHQPQHRVNPCASDIL